MASIGQKRDWAVSEIEEANDACVHGIPQLVSPVKESKSTKGVKYFDARISDGKKVRRVVSFDAGLQAALKKAEEEESVIALENSKVKKNSVTKQLEVHLNKHSQVTASPRKFELGNTVVSNEVTRLVKVADVADLAVNQVVEVKGKVWEVKDVEDVKKKNGDGKTLQKQDVLIGDETKSCRLVLWEQDVNSVEEGKSYLFIGVGVRMFGGSKYLSFTTDSNKELAEDLEDVNEECIGDEEDEEQSGRTVKGEIVSVISATEYLSCKFCRCKAVAEDEYLAECSKCGSVMKISKCEKTQAAKFVVEGESGREITLSAFEPILSRIVDGASGSMLSRKLLRASGKVFRFNDKNVVFSVQNAS